MVDKMDIEPTLSVIILNYKNADLTAKCIDYLVKSVQKAKIQTQVIVVDNSANETADILKRILPKNVEIIENSENFGFSRANNQGIHISRGKYILLLNNDAFVNCESLKGGIEYLDNNEECGIWSPKLVGKDGSFQVSCANFPSIKGLIGEYLLFKNLDLYNDVLEWQEPKNVGTVTGAFMLIKREVTEKVGLLDENFFFNVEDVDYCKRVNDEGFKVIYDPRFSIVHVGSASQDEAWVNNPYLHDCRIFYFNKHYNEFGALLSNIIIKTGLIVRKFLLWRKGESK